MDEALKRAAKAAVLVIGVTLLPYLSSLDNDFVNWDDHWYVTDNDVIKELSWKNLKEMFSGFYVGIYCPLVLLSYALEHALFGLNPFVYHLTNLLLHVGNTLLVWCFIVRLGEQASVALIAALLFGVHPIHVESVAWVTERKDVLSTLFFLAALLCYLRYQQTGRTRPYGLSLFVFLLSLLSKPMGVTLPLILFLCDFLAGRRGNRHTLLEKVPFFLLSALFGVVAFFGQASGGYVRFVGPLESLLLAARAIFFYISKTLVPVRLSAMYLLPEAVRIWSLDFFFLSMVLLGLGIMVFVSRRYTRKVAFGTLFFLIALLPVLRLVPKTGAEAVADRFMYIPSLGLFYLIGVAFHSFRVWQVRLAEARRGLSASLASVIIFTLAVLTWQRCNVWQNSETLWLSVLKRYPNSPTAHKYLGNAYHDKELLDAAITEYEQALALDPAYTLAHANLGFAYTQKGLLEAAMVEYKQALALDPTYALVHSHLGDIYNAKGLLEEAIVEYEQALTLDPACAPAHNGRGTLYAKKGELEAAITEYEKALALSPAFAKVHYNLALVYYNKRDYQSAIQHHDRARELGYSVPPQLSEALQPYR